MYCSIKIAPDTTVIFLSHVISQYYIMIYQLYFIAVTFDNSHEKIWKKELKIAQVII